MRRSSHRQPGLDQQRRVQTAVPSEIIAIPGIATRRLPLRSSSPVPRQCDRESAVSSQDRGTPALDVRNSVASNTAPLPDGGLDRRFGHLARLNSIGWISSIPTLRSTALPAAGAGADRIPTPSDRNSDNFQIPYACFSHHLPFIIQRNTDECIGSILAEHDRLSCCSSTTDRYRRFGAQSATVTLKRTNASAHSISQRRRRPEISDWTTHGANSWSRGPDDRVTRPSPTTRRQHIGDGVAFTNLFGASRKRQAPQRTHPDLCDTGLPGHGRWMPGHARNTPWRSCRADTALLTCNKCSRAMTNGTACASTAASDTPKTRYIHGPVLRPYHPPRQQQQPHTITGMSLRVCCAER